MTGLDRLNAPLSRHGLGIVGAFHPGAEDGAPEGCRTLALIGANGPRMWDVFAASPEATDGEADPLDRWSTRVIGAIAAAEGAEALFPFGGPPHQPFLRWAAQGEGCRPSPVGLPVSPQRGLWASYRGALAYSARLPLAPPTGRTPCAPCAAPCRSACPVGALTPTGYDVAACAAHLARPEGAACRHGCLVRAACPIGTPPPEAQRAFHMAAFAAGQRS
ncbi:MAG: ferredoxin [Pikeienuella sp.]